MYARAEKMYACAEEKKNVKACTENNSISQTLLLNIHSKPLDYWCIDNAV
jgi:hypothetical protein